MVPKRVFRRHTIHTSIEAFCSSTTEAQDDMVMQPHRNLNTKDDKHSNGQNPSISVHAAIAQETRPTILTDFTHHRGVQAVKGFARKMMKKMKGR